MEVDRSTDARMSASAGDFLCVCDHYFCLTVLSEFVIAKTTLFGLHRIALLFWKSLARLLGGKSLVKLEL